MAKKKKAQEAANNFIPSKYQTAIFDFILNGQGNLLVEAAAGSGKSTTIVESLKLIDGSKSVLFCAFNKDIVKELEKRTKKLKNVVVKTVHGLGYTACMNSIDGVSRQPDTMKYKVEFVNHTKDYTLNDKNILGWRKWQSYSKNIFHLIDLLRLNLVTNAEQAIKVCERYEMSLHADEINVCLKLMEWGSIHTDTMDYTDMVWYSNIFDINLSELYSFDYIFVDEAQDLSKAQREFLLKCGHNDTRFVFVGDGNQAIYGFSAADPESFNELRKLPNTTSLPLSICYRCPKSVIDFVHNIVPTIEAKEDAIDGEIRHDRVLSDVNDGDMILCRTNAPLLQIYNTYLRMGRKCFVKGKDIGKNLADVVKSTQQTQLNMNLEGVGVFSKLYQDFFSKRHQIMQLSGLDSKTCEDTPILANMLDMIDTLKVISEGLTTTAQLLDRISRIFTDDINEGIILSTVHKAKGLEANNVYIARKDLLGRQTSPQEWERVQERNLEYVAYTRPKRLLGFLKIDENTTMPKIPLRFIEEKLQHLNNKPKILTGQMIFNSTISGRTTPGVGKVLGDKPSSINPKTRPLGELFARKQPRR